MADSRGGEALELVWVELAAAASRTDALSAVAAALGLRIGSPSAEGAEREIGAALAARQALLFLDDCDQVAAELGVVLSGWLARAPSVRIVASSRVPFDVSLERAVDVPPLDRDAACRLFEARAEQWTGISVSERPEVERIVDELDRIPLAIELAACRADLFSPEELLEEVSRATGLLEGGRRDAPERHRSLDAAIRWSWDLLRDRDRELLGRSAAFAGDFDHAAARAVLGEPGEERQVADGLSRLRRVGLLRVSEASGARARRFELLASVRKFVVAERGAGAEAELRHAKHFVERLAWRAEDRRGPDRAEREAALARDRRELRAIAERFAERRPDLATSAALGWASWVERHAPAGEWIASLERAVAIADRSGDAELRARAHAALGYAYGVASRNEDCVRASELAHRLALADHPAIAAAASMQIAWAERALGNRVTARAAADRSVLEAERGADRAVRAEATAAVARMLLWDGDLARARVLLEEAAGELRSIGDDLGEARVVEALGLVVGDLGATLRHRDRARVLFEKIGDARQACRAGINVAVTEAQLGFFDRAEVRMREGLEVAKRCGYAYAEVAIQLNLGVLLHRRALMEPETAAERLEQATSCLIGARAKDIPHPPLKALTSAHLAAAYASRGDTDRAREYLEEARSPEDTGPHATTVAILRELVGLAGAAPSEVERVGGWLATIPWADPKSGLHSDVREAASLLAWTLAAKGARPEGLPRVLWIGEGVRWFRVQDGHRVDLARHPVLARLLSSLLERHRADPAGTLGTDEIVSRVWPSERFADADSGRNRLWVLVNKLRKLGLDSALERAGAGYRLDPRVSVIVVGDARRVL
jgi:predicted ATPase